MKDEYTNREDLFFRYVFICTFFIVPVFSYANVSITEIMYDVSGSDTGHEWIELRANIETDLSGWKFFEADTNHTLVLVKGLATIPSGGFAVIVDNAEKFLADFPIFSGTLFDSSFSLSNTGETIVLRDNTGTSTDSVSYASSWGARGDGNSLQKDGTTWTQGIPTPGAAFVKKKEEPVPLQENEAKDIALTTPSQEKTKETQATSGKKEADITVDMAIADSKIETSVPAKEAKNNSLSWWSALVVVTIFAAGSVIWVRRKEQKTGEVKPDELSADDFEIIDITEK